MTYDTLHYSVLLSSCPPSFLPSLVGSLLVELFVCLVACVAWRCVAWRGVALRFVSSASWGTRGENQERESVS